MWGRQMDTEDERKRRRLDSQSDAHVCFITRLADKRLNLLVGLPHQENTVPLQDLHSCTGLLEQTHALEANSLPTKIKG